MKTSTRSIRNGPRRRAGQPSAPALVEEGNRFRAVGDWERAEEVYRRATEIDPECSDAWAELGCLMSDARQFPQAADCFQHVVGNSLSANTNQSGAALVTNSGREAVRMLEEIAAARPKWTRGQFSLGCAYEHLEDYEPARAHLGNALILDPSREAAVQALLARMFCLEENWTEGIAAADRAIAAQSTYFLAHVVRSTCCAAIGDWAGSVASSLSAVKILPHVGFHSNVMFDMNYLPETTPESVYAEACRWNASYAAPLASEIRPHTNTPDPDRRLKIGYVSPDLRIHAIAKFLLPVLDWHDSSQVEVFLYDVGTKPDHLTELMRGKVENFVPAQVPHLELVKRVRADGIDILVDLAGHTMGPAILAFAAKPAPVQVSWLGVLSTTGMPAIDYFLGDPEMPCPGTEPLFAETVYRLPRSMGCYRPTDNVPVAPAPSVERGYVTFGCFNNPRKIHRDLVKLWSAIMHLVPESRLLLKWHGLEPGVKQDRILQWFADDGIAPERLRFDGPSMPARYLAEYGEIDIALDPFPYNGGSTTLDSLWMGVPVVTLAGRLPVQRTGASVLTAIGLSDLVAQTPEQYLNIALYLASIVSKMPNLRQEVRKALQSSAWMDEIGIVRDVENAYRDMWRRWCLGASRDHSSMPDSIG